METQSTPLPHPSHAPEGPPRETPASSEGRNQFRRQNDGTNRKLVLMVGLMLVVGLLIWLAYAATGYFKREELPRVVSSSSPAIPALRIDAAPKPAATRDNGGDSRYAQLLAMIESRFAEYDKALASRPAVAMPQTAPEPPLASVVFNTSSRPGRGVGSQTVPGAAIPGIAGTGNPVLLPPTEADEARRPDPGVDDLLKPSVLAGEKASKMPNRNFLLAQGTHLECVLETAIDTSVPGMATCILSRDIYGDSARVLLLEKGSKLVGEYRGAMRAGQRRMFLIWNRVVTPHGVAIKLGSPGTDTLGRAGVDGFLDNRYLERFGAALLVSIVADVIPAVIQAGVNQATVDQSVEMQMTGTAGAQMGAEIIRQNALVPPILRKNQGDLVSIIVARDLDFSSVYSLRLK